MDENLPEIHLRNYLHDHIPLSKAMGVDAITVSVDEVVLSAPLEPNINHRQTALAAALRLSPSSRPGGTSVNDRAEHEKFRLSRFAGRR